MRKNLRDVLLITQDTGMRPSEIYRMRIENLDFANRQIWNPYGKTEVPALCAHVRTVSFNVAEH